MKKLSFLICLCTLISFGADAQKNPPVKDLEGAWNIFVMNIPNMMHYNSATDSLSMDMKAMGIESDEQMDENSKLMMMDAMKSSMKKEFEKMIFKFDAAGVMYEKNGTTDSTMIMGTYDPTTGQIKLKDITDGKEEKLSLQLENGVLTLFKEADGMIVTMICKRKKD